MKNRVTGCTRNRVIKHGWTIPYQQWENQTNMAKSMKITYPLVIEQFAIENDPVEIVDLHGFTH